MNETRVLRESSLQEKRNIDNMMCSCCIVCSNAHKADLAREYDYHEIIISFHVLHGTSKINLNLNRGRTTFEAETIYLHLPYYLSSRGGYLSKRIVYSVPQTHIKTSLNKSVQMHNCAISNYLNKNIYIKQYLKF
jgi:hypothetical protein